MKDKHLNRRAFTRLSMAALGGLVAGTIAGCQGKTGGGSGDLGQANLSQAANTDANEAHVCRGLNTCKGKGKASDNACAGQGSCATVASHTCDGTNSCKGQGGCDDTAGHNDCKGKGSCNVPLKDKTWVKARKRFEEEMSKAGKTFGEAPPKKA